MKRIFTLVALLAAVLVSSCVYDDTSVWNAITDLQNRMQTVEKLCQETNTNLESLQKIVNAISNNEHIKNIAPIHKDGNVIGYTITFTSGESVTIYNDNKEDNVASVPQMGVAQDTDGVYYWTLNGEWLLDANGNKIKAEGEDGLTPKFKIEKEFWYVSYDNGLNWEVLGKATTEINGCDCQSIIKGVVYDDKYVYVKLADGTVLVLSRETAPEIPYIPVLGIEAVDLGLSVKWASCNVGAESPEGHGDYFAWGEISPKNEYYEINSTTYGVELGDISGNPQYDAATANWGDGWRMPTRDEFIELKYNCIWEWTVLNGVNVMRVLGPNGNSIFLPAAGFRYGTSFNGVGSSGYYWCSMPSGDFNDYAYRLYFYGEDLVWNGYYRYSGLSIRPVMDK